MQISVLMYALKAGLTLSAMLDDIMVLLGTYISYVCRVKDGNGRRKKRCGNVKRKEDWMKSNEKNLSVGHEGSLLL